MKARIIAEPNQIIIRSTHAPRHGWDEAFRHMADRGDDVLDDEAVSLTAFDETEWKWLFAASTSISSTWILSLSHARAAALRRQARLGRPRSDPRGRPCPAREASRQDPARHAAARPRPARRALRGVIRQRDGDRHSCLSYVCPTKRRGPCLPAHAPRPLLPSRRDSGGVGLGRRAPSRHGP